MQPLVKICGLTNYEDAALALDLGADAIGFVLAASPRRVEPAVAADILSRLRSEGRLPPPNDRGRAPDPRPRIVTGSSAPRAFGPRAIGVFVNEDPAAMADIIDFVGLDAAQVHGDEAAEDCARFGFPWYRALRARDGAEACALAAMGWACPRLLFDASVAGAYGGSGKAVPGAVALAARDGTRGAGMEFFLAGGIGAANVADILDLVAPDGIDVCSGVEEGPGRKSRAAMEKLFSEIRRSCASATAEGRTHGKAQ
jgi:phosphoribosylanthranilate isomerase